MKVFRGLSLFRLLACLALALGAGDVFAARQAEVSVAPPVAAASPMEAPVLGAANPQARGDQFSKLVTQVTGVAISPLLGIGAVGAWDYFKTEDKTTLSWYAQPWFWLSSLVLVALVAAKDSLGAAVPAGWKKPLDVADAVENKVTALLATGAFVPVIVDQFSKFLADSGGAKTAEFLPAAAGALPLASFDWSPLLTIAMVPFAAAVFLVVWLLGHAINVLILISPFGQVDAALKGVRVSVMGLLALTSAVSPGTAAMLSGVIILVAALLAGWAFRLTVFGSIFCWDFFSFRTYRYKVDQRVNAAFAGRRLPGVPNRSYGKVVIADDGRVVFTWRSFLFGPKKEVELPTRDTILGKGLFYPVVTQVENATDKPRHLLTWPPRYRGHEDELRRVYRFAEIREVGLLRGWAWVKEMLGFGPAEAAEPGK